MVRRNIVAQLLVQRARRRDIVLRLLGVEVYPVEGLAQPLTRRPSPALLVVIWHSPMLARLSCGSVAVARAQWQAAMRDHQRDVDAWTAPRLARRAIGATHAVDDFLFDYYPISPGKLRAWHPGWQVELEAHAGDLTAFPGTVYEWASGVVRIRADWVARTHDRIRATVTYLEAVHARPARAGCFALHEWAMVLDAPTVRHATHPMRVAPDLVRATVQELGLRCTHFDAFRFFTDAARPLNPQPLTRDSQIDMDQPGCLHANMDLYKHAVALAPVIGSTLVREAFLLARDIRQVDMQVAPYDLRSLGVEPIPIETDAGRAQFAAAQRDFAQRAAQLRGSIIAGAHTALR